MDEKIKETEKQEVTNNPADELRKQLELANKADEMACRAICEAALVKYGCEIQPTIITRGTSKGTETRTVISFVKIK